MFSHDLYKICIWFTIRFVGFQVKYVSTVIFARYVYDLCYDLWTFKSNIFSWTFVSNYDVWVIINIENAWIQIMNVQNYVYRRIIDSRDSFMCLLVRAYDRSISHICMSNIHKVGDALVDRVEIIPHVFLWWSYQINLKSMMCYEMKRLFFMSYDL